MQIERLAFVAFPVQTLDRSIKWIAGKVGRNRPGCRVDLLDKESIASLNCWWCYIERAVCMARRTFYIRMGSPVAVVGNSVFSITANSIPAFSIAAFYIS